MNYAVKIRLIIFSVFLLTAEEWVFAGGYLAVDTNGNPYKWNLPIEVRFDQGPLGDYTKAEADAFTLESLEKWTNSKLPEVNVVFNRGSDLEKDYGNGDGLPEPLIDLNTYETDNVTPIIYDQTSLVTQHFLGSGIIGVVGFAGITVPENLQPGLITDGIVVMNGAFFKKAEPGMFAALTEDELKGAITHEIGHLLNLDHSVINAAFGDNSINLDPDYIGFPTMYPIINAGISTLEFDDIAWISSLYPINNNSGGKISGFTKKSTGELLNGVNIVAHNATDISQTISVVSGFNDPSPDITPTGYYELPGLPLGSNWVVSTTPISASFAGGSRVGPLTVPLNPPGPAEFLNSEDDETNGDDAAHSTTFRIPQEAPASLSNINLIYNSVTTQTITRTVIDGSSANAQVLNPYPGIPLKVSGIVDTNRPNQEGLLIGSFFNFPPIGEWFVIEPEAHVELNQLFLTSPHDLDYWILTVVEEEGIGAVLGEGGSDFYLNPLLTSYQMQFDDSILQLLELLLPGNDIAELLKQTASPKNRLDTHIDTMTAGTGPYKGKVYIGITAQLEETGLFPYDLTIVTRTSDRDALVVSHIVEPLINPETPLLTLKGRGFKSSGGLPTVTFSKPGLTANAVEVVNDTTIVVSIMTGSDYLPGGFTDITVKNHALSGGFSGTLKNQKVLGDSGIEWEIY